MQSVRPAREADLSAIAAIYAHYVEHTSITFDLEAPSVEQWRERLQGAEARTHPWMVTESSGALAGYATASQFRPKLAYRSTIETTIYMAPDAVGKGLGQTLYEGLLREAAQNSFHLAVAGITLPNRASVALHERTGFTAVGVFEQVGNKLGAWRDVGWWQRRL